MHPYVMHLVIDQDQFPFTIIPLLKKKREVAPTHVLYSTFYNRFRHSMYHISGAILVLSLVLSVS